MNRFTKDDVLNELRVIFLFEADHILMGAGEKMAETFIGYGTGDDGEYCAQDPALVDLARFPISRLFADGYDYAFHPRLALGWDGHEVQDLVTFMLATPRAGGIMSGGEVHRFMTPEGHCQQVADAAFARWKLEHDPAGTGTHTFTTRELALLANMTEGAVRNALADRSENGLKGIPGSKPISVEHDEAWRWLSGRRGFFPSPTRPSEDRFLREHLRDLTSVEALSRLVSQWVGIVFQTTERASQTLDWSVAELTSWQDGTFRFSPEQALKLGKALDFDAPLFAGKAMEISLRRDGDIQGDQK